MPSVARPKGNRAQQIIKTEEMDTFPKKEIRKRKTFSDTEGTPSKQKPKPYANSVKEDGKPDWKKMRIEAKNLKEARKKKEMKPEIYAMSQKAKLLWEDLRKESCSAEDRVKLCNQIHGLIHENIKRLAFAHDTTRVIEALLSYGSETIRLNVHKSFEAKEDKIALMKSKYGHFLAIKLLKYATPEQREEFFKVFEVHAPSLLRHQYACKVLSDFYTTHAKAEQRYAIIKDCYAPLMRLESVSQELKDVLEKFPDRKDAIFTNILEIMNTMLDKGLKASPILHYLVHQYLENCPHLERTEFMEKMREDLVNILHTFEGSSLVMSCLWHGSPKDRKAIIKSFKGHIPKIACDKFGHFVLLAAFDCVDDVVLITKAVCNEITLNLNDLMLNEYGQRVLAYLLEHRTPLFFDPEIKKILEKGDQNEYTKKPVAQRIEQVSANLGKSFLKGISDNFGLWLNDNSAMLITKIILKRYKDDDLSTALDKIAEVLADTSTADGIERRSTEMMVKSIFFDLPMEPRTSFAESLLAALKTHNAIKRWMSTGRGCFTLLRILEKCGEETEVGNDVTAIVKANASILKKADTPGGKLLWSKCKD